MDPDGAAPVALDRLAAPLRAGHGFGRQPRRDEPCAGREQAGRDGEAGSCGEGRLCSAARQKGNRYLQLRVKSPLAKAKVRIVLIGKNGKASRIVLRTIATNRMVLVPNLKLGKPIKSVRVSVA